MWYNYNIERKDREMGSIYQRYELEAFVGSENMGDFDIDAIEAEATEIDYGTGNRVWRDGIDLAEICEAHDFRAER